MTALVFETPGLIDVRAFTLMGVSAKPKSANPIGYFGTGLKYAVAVLVRLGCEPRVFIGQDEYVFTKSPLDFRGSQFTMIGMRAKKLGWRGWRHTQLPYSTEYGKNWEPWMVYRELESNTRDEGGETYLNEIDPFMGAPGFTRIVVNEPGVLQAHAERDKIFLPDAAREGSGVQVITRPSEDLYWRSLRVHKLSKPALFTYNVLDPAQLTEDRTLNNDWSARLIVGQAVLSSQDEAFIEKVITANDKVWESDLIYPEHQRPSRAFHEVMKRHPKGLRTTAWVYYGRHDERVREETYSLNLMHPKPWKLAGNQVCDAKGQTVFEAPYGYPGKWGLAANEILKVLQPASLPTEEPEGSVDG